MDLESKGFVTCTLKDMDTYKDVDKLQINTKSIINGPLSEEMAIKVLDIVNEKSTDKNMTIIIDEIVNIFPYNYESFSIDTFLFSFGLKANMLLTFQSMNQMAQSSHKIPLFSPVDAIDLLTNNGYIVEFI